MALSQRILQELIQAEATARIGAEPGEHTETRRLAFGSQRVEVLAAWTGQRTGF
ncbi:hypothetical protein [Streptomyces sp. NPDC056190]|uniref:hypothetical protein n=1 Tax=unclassified Streptomyces TaxID=2593676 RepID=UPI0035DF0DB6